METLDLIYQYIDDGQMWLAVGTAVGFLILTLIAETLDRRDKENGKI